MRKLQPYMKRFFDTKAKGDKWVPWHTCLGTHEKYTFQSIYSLAHLDDKEKYLLLFAFRATSWIPVFKSIILPYFTAQGADRANSAAWKEWKRMLHQPKQVFCAGSTVHKKFKRFKAQPGNKLHTNRPM